MMIMKRVATKIGRSKLPLGVPRAKKLKKAFYLMMRLAKILKNSSKLGYLVSNSKALGLALKM